MLAAILALSAAGAAQRRELAACVSQAPEHLREKDSKVAGCTKWCKPENKDRQCGWCKCQTCAYCQLEQAAARQPEQPQTPVTFATGKGWKPTKQAPAPQPQSQQQPAPTKPQAEPRPEPHPSSRPRTPHVSNV